MARPSTFLLLVGLAAVIAIGKASSGIGLNIHHRSSPVVREWAQARGHPAAAWWPKGEGTPDYYSALSRHDHARHRGKSLLTFADGNITFRLDGSLHYAEVAVGTPRATFLVALDTGSALFWLTCDCKQCATIPKNAPMHGRGRPAQAALPYSPRRSSTSKPVMCGDALCGRPKACARATHGSSCPYTMTYASPNTSSTGVLVEDVLHLTRYRESSLEAVKAPVVLGCGKSQTGDFALAAMDGLLGLGMEKVTVPSMLAAGGLVSSNSFSMCFSPDGSGRINFGDAGIRGQAETPFIARKARPTYNISVTAINVDQKVLAAEFAAVVDSGTSFTYINEPAYTALATSFDSQISEKRTDLASSIPFEYCYKLDRGQKEVVMPEVSLTTQWGAVFPVTRPFVVIEDESKVAVGYCLAVLRSTMPINLIGQNFMAGLKVVFDRERSVLGWHKFDCYKGAVMEDHGDGKPAGAAPAIRLKPRQ